MRLIIIESGLGRQLRQSLTFLLLNYGKMVKGHDNHCACVVGVVV